MIEANFTLIVLPIKGVGVFSNAYFEEEEFIGEYVESRPSKLGRKLTATLWESDPLGRFCNHSERPNTTLVKTENGYNLYANRPIDKGDEITVSYHVVEYKLERPKGEYFKFNFVNRDYKNYGKSICEY
jgi:hypothetical protein